MQHIDTNKNGIGIYFIPSETGTGGECNIVDENKNYKVLDEVFGHTKKVAIERARAIRRKIVSKKTIHKHKKSTR